MLKGLVVRLTMPRLVRAARNGDFAKIRRLIAHGAKVDVSDGYGRTCLMEACRAGHNETVRFLLECGADPYIESLSGKNAFEYALNRKVMEVLPTRQASGEIHTEYLRWELC